MSAQYFGVWQLVCESSPDFWERCRNRSVLAGIFVTVSRSKAAGAKSAATDTADVSQPKRARSGPLTFFILVIIVALGSIQLISTFHSYAEGLAELNGLKKQESALIAQKAALENDIARWDDKAYITAQARGRLGFVFPGEQAVTVLHPEAVTDDDDDPNDAHNQQDAGISTIPWYAQVNDALTQADKPPAEGETDTP